MKQTNLVDIQDSQGSKSGGESSLKVSKKRHLSDAGSNQTNKFITSASAVNRNSHKNNGLESDNENGDYDV